MNIKYAAEILKQIICYKKNNKIISTSQERMGNTPGKQINSLAGQCCQKATFKSTNQSYTKTELFEESENDPYQVAPPMAITIKLANQQSVQVEVKRQALVIDIKQQIYDKISKELKVQQMSLFHRGRQYTNQENMMAVYCEENSFAIRENRKLCFVIQQKRTGSLNNSRNSTSMRQDRISGEKAQIQMSCGHWFSQSTIIGQIKHVIESKGYELRCVQYDQDQNRCEGIWQLKECKKFLKQEEFQAFSQGLTSNYCSKNWKKCPYCQNYAQKGRLKSNRVRCIRPSCYSKNDFCYFCLTEWKPGQPQCISKTCTQTNYSLATSPKLVFSLKDENGCSSQVQVPKRRLCPQCNVMIQHGGYCKHMTCKDCSTEFCFVCLSLPKSNKHWPCGSRDNYCQKGVAPIQKTSIM